MSAEIDPRKTLSYTAKSGRARGRGRDGQHIR
jgi:hypothetical protein